MTRRKDYFNFTDFNYVDGAIDLFHNTVRGAFKYDALTDDVFQARVLTFPTPIVEDPEDLGGAIGSQNQKYSFRVRILGRNSPHKFLEDPCLIEDGSDDATANNIFSIIQNHTQVILYDEATERKPKIGDIVNIKLSRTGNSYDINRAQQYLGIASDTDGTDVKGISRPDCSNLSALFEDEDYGNLSTFSDGERGAAKIYPDLDSPEVMEVYALWETLTTAEDREKLEKCGGTGGDDLVECKVGKFGGSGRDATLHPKFWDEAEAAYNKVVAAGLGEPISVGSTKRTPKVQISLRIGNKTREMTPEEIISLREKGAFKPATATVPTTFGSGGSNHLYGLAIDFNGILQQPNTEEAELPNSEAKQSKTYKYMKSDVEKEGFRMNSKEAGDAGESWHFSHNGG